MIQKVIKERMEVIGLTQAKLAEAIGCTPTQLGLFLRDEASLNKNSLNKCFQALGISLDSISKRIDLAKRAAKALKNVSIEKVVSMTREEMINETKIPEIIAFPVVSKNEFEMMIASCVADYESTFQYFKALVLFFMKSPEKQTPKSAENSLSILASVLIDVPFMPFMGVSTVIGAAVGALAVKRKFLSRAINNAWGPILTLSMSIFDKNENE